MVGGTDNGRQKTRNHGYDVIVGGELFTGAQSPSQTCHATLKTQINERTLPASFPLVGCLQTAWPERLLSEKSGRCNAHGQGGVALYPMIDRGDIRQAIGVQQYLGFTARALVMVRTEHKADSLIAKFKEAGGTVREIDV